MDNPYQPPSAGLSEQPADKALYSPNAVMACAIVFTPVVGGLMARRNWVRLGDSVRARNAALYSGLATMAMFVLGALLPDSLEAGIRGAFIGGTVGTGMWLRRELQPAFAKHVESGGQTAGPWVIVAVGVVLLVGALALVFMKASA